MEIRTAPQKKKKEREKERNKKIIMNFLARVVVKIYSIRKKNMRVKYFRWG